MKKRSVKTAEDDRTGWSPAPVPDSPGSFQVDWTAPQPGSFLTEVVATRGGLRVPLRAPLQQLQRGRPESQTQQSGSREDCYTYQTRHRAHWREPNIRSPVRNVCAAKRRKSLEPFVERGLSTETARPAQNFSLTQQFQAVAPFQTDGFGKG